MLNFHAEKHDQYKSDYDQFFQSRKRERYLRLSESAGYSSDMAALLRYSAFGCSNQIFLVVPSIFNSPEILFLNENNNFIKNLQKKGDVFLVEWLENSRQLLMNDYVNELCKVISHLQLQTDKKLV